MWQYLVACVPDVLLSLRIKTLSGVFNNCRGGGELMESSGGSSAVFTQGFQLTSGHIFE